MRKPFLVIGLLTVTAAATFAQTTPKTGEQASSAEQSVLQVTREWLAAEEGHDRATLQKIIADDFQGTGPGGNTVFKGRRHAGRG